MTPPTSLDEARLHWQASRPASSHNRVANSVRSAVSKRCTTTESDSAFAAQMDVSLRARLGELLTAGTLRALATLFAQAGPANE
jgi:hypothetical protein